MKKVITISFISASMLFALSPIHDKMDSRIKGKSYSGSLDDNKAAEDGLGILPLQHHTGTTDMNNELLAQKIFNRIVHTETDKTKTINIRQSLVNGVVGTVTDVNLLNNVGVDTVVTSCQDILSKGLSTGSGMYDIKRSTGMVNVYCDMTTDGGGYTYYLFDNDSTKNNQIPASYFASYDTMKANCTAKGLNLISLQSKEQVKSLKTIIESRGYATGLANMGTALAQDPTLKNKYFDLSDSSREVTYIFDQLRMEGWAGDFWTDQTSASDPQYCAGFGWSNSGIEDWGCYGNGNHTALNQLIVCSTNDKKVSPNPYPDMITMSSCKDVKLAHPDVSNGYYDLSTGNMYCDMTTDGGGWSIKTIGKTFTTWSQYEQACAALGMGESGRGVEDVDAWLAAKRFLYNTNHPLEINYGWASASAYMAMPIHANIGGNGNYTMKYNVIPTLPSNLTGDACNASQEMCGYWFNNGWLGSNLNAYPDPEDWDFSSATTKYWMCMFR